LHAGIEPQVVGVPLFWHIVACGIFPELPGIHPVQL